MQLKQIEAETSMEKLQEEQENQISKSRVNISMWDCGSALYDSFELNSFKRQLDSAIANSSRTLSMPRLPDRRLTPLPLQLPQQPPSTRSKSSSKISRSLQKFIRSIFKPNSHKNKSTISSPFIQVPEKSKDCLYVVYDKSGPVLSTIPEIPEFENINSAVSPEISSLVRRSASERFTGIAIGVPCA